MADGGVLVGGWGLLLGVEKVFYEAKLDAEFPDKYLQLHWEDWKEVEFEDWS